MIGTVASIIAQVAVIYTYTGTVGNFNCGTPNAENIKLGGYFQLGTNQVTICNQSDKKYTLIHESGHYLYFEKMPEIERKRWVKLSLANKVPSAYVSGYAATNPQEDFAETFAFIGTNGKVPYVSFRVNGYNERLSKIAFVRKMIRKYGN